ncbi:hypothetical protein B9Z55_028001 [Caenorhabditis nigoni]|uniref:Uncharacterized protein n=1 Tax=Caenorhabditis nigoni TaxID=1611254 RepID=A0A2G5SE38_9PELO|nr:hypothetical protein B9Z55_028001 [Caenorhabditis nigoni]
MEQANAAYGRLAEKLNASEEKSRKLKKKKLIEAKAEVERLRDAEAQRHQEQHDLRMELERLRDAEENRRKSMTPEDPSSESIFVDTQAIFCEYQAMTGLIISRKQSMTKGKLQESAVSNNELEGKLKMMAAEKGRLHEENRTLETTVKTLQAGVTELQTSVEHLLDLAQKLREAKAEVERLRDAEAQRHQEEHDLRMELERLRAAEKNRRESMAPEDPSSESIFVDTQAIFCGYQAMTRLINPIGTGPSNSTPQGCRNWAPETSESEARDTKPTKLNPGRRSSIVNGKLASFWSGDN